MKNYLDRINMIQVILAWALLLILFVDWEPSFIFILINFIYLKTIATADLFLVGAMISIPISGFLLSLLGLKFAKTLRTISHYLLPVLLLASAYCAWAFYNSYYQLSAWFVYDIDMLTGNSAPIGLISLPNSNVQYYMLLTNALIFYGVVPALMITISEGTGQFQIDQNTNYGLLIASMYFFLRPGSVSGFGLRIAWVAMIFIAIWGCLKVYKVYSKVNVVNLDNHANLDINSDSSTYKKLSMQNTPLFSEFGILFLFGFWFGASGISMNGLLSNTWVWIFVFLGSLANLVRFRKLSKLKFTRQMGYAIFLLSWGVSILFVLCQLSGALLRFYPIILSVGLFLTTLFLGFVIDIFNKKYEQKFFRWFQVNPLRQFIWGLLLLIGFMGVFLAGIQDPISTYVFVGVICVFCGSTSIMLVFYLKNSWN